MLPRACNSLDVEGVQGAIAGSAPDFGRTKKGVSDQVGIVHGFGLARANIELWWFVSGGRLRQALRLPHLSALGRAGTIYTVRGGGCSAAIPPTAANVAWQACRSSMGVAQASGEAPYRSGT